MGSVGIDIDDFESRGLLNLRCPACRLIAEEDVCSTDRQRAYADSVGHAQAMKMAEEAVQAAQEQLQRALKDAFRGNRLFEITASHPERPQLGGREVPDANYHFTWKNQSCGACGFGFRVADAAWDACPVCR